MAQRKKKRRKPLRRGGGKSKGNRFENWVARRLSLWITQGQDKTQLIPTRLSGGWRFGQKGNEAWRQVGDLAPNGSAGEEFRRRFAVECKHHRKIDLWDLLTRPRRKDTLLGWWVKLREETRGTYVLPLVVLRMNNRPTLIAFPVDAFRLHRIPREVHVPEFGMVLARFDDVMKLPWEGK